MGLMGLIGLMGLKGRQGDGGDKAMGRQGDLKTRNSYKIQLNAKH
jgi:hypothetical protein